MAQKTKDMTAVATLTIKGAATMTDKEIGMVVDWLRRTANALMTRQRFNLSKNYKATLHQVRG